MNPFKKLYTFFDKLEDHIRAWLSRRPILYGLIAGLGAVLFFRGVWMVLDETYLGGWESIGISLVILLLTGAFVSHFVSNELITSGLRKQKKIVEQTGSELEGEIETLRGITKELEKMKREVTKIKTEHEREHQQK